MRDPYALYAANLSSIPTGYGLALSHTPLPKEWLTTKITKLFSWLIQCYLLSYVIIIGNTIEQAGEFGFQ